MNPLTSDHWLKWANQRRWKRNEDGSITTDGRFHLVPDKDHVRIAVTLWFVNGDVAMRSTSDEGKALDGQEGSRICTIVTSGEMAQAVALVQTEIRHDVIVGRVPANVDSFDSLCLFAHANLYGGFEDLSDEERYAVETAVDGWIKAGGIDVPGRAAKFRVETNFTYGWDDASWTEDEEPLLFPTAKAARDAIDEFIADQREAFKRGDKADEYDPADYRVAIMHEAFIQFAESPAQKGGVKV